MCYWTTGCVSKLIITISVLKTHKNRQISLQQHLLAVGVKIMKIGVFSHEYMHQSVAFS